MKKIKQNSIITTIITIVLIIMAFSAIANAESVNEEKDNEYYKKTHIEQYQQINKEAEENHPGTFGVKSTSDISRYKGVDVSKWDGSTIDWKKAADKNGKYKIKFAIVRVSYTSWDATKSNFKNKIYEDNCYRKNIIKASAAGLKVGAYHYSQALTESEAKAEAKYIISKLNEKIDKDKKARYKDKITMPVVIDYEKVGNSSSRLDRYIESNASDKKATMTKVVKAFENTIKKAGYHPMVYANGVVLKNLDYKQVKPIWYAGDEYNQKYEMHQYSFEGSLPGSSAETDMNRWYTNDFDKYTPYSGKATVSVCNITQNSVSASWTKPASATKYVVSLTDLNGKNVANKTVASNSCNFSGLKSNKTYKVSVLAYRKTVAGTKSNVVSFTTKEAEKAIPAEPYAGMVKISSSNASNYSTIKWNAEPQATKYVVQISTNKTSWSNKAIVTTTSYKLSGLSNGNAKYARVIPYKGNEKGKVSNVVIAHGKFKYTVKDSKGNKMSYKLGSVYYTNKHVKAIGNIKITAKTKAKNGLVLRKKASASSKKILTIPYNKTVTIISQGKSWNKVSYKKGSKTYKGYVANAYLN